MPPRSIDLIALGPAPLDPYDPAAGAWALAGAYAARGDDVRVIRPEGPGPGPPPPGIGSIEVPLPPRRPGAAVEDARFAEAAGRRVRRAVDLIVRDPSGLGALRVPDRSPRNPPLVGFVRAVELATFDAERARLGQTGIAHRLDAWRDRRSVRRLELAALSEADVLFAEDATLGPPLVREYGLPEGRVRAAVPPVPELPRPASRDAARAALDIPRDVPVAVAPLPDDRPEAPALARARETFRRIRPLFPGARLVVVGSTAPTDPGVISVPGRDGAAFGAGLAAANVALFAGGQPSFDPMVVAAMRGGCAIAAVPSVHLPIPPDGAVQYSATEDPGDLASTLAELFADPSLVRSLVEAGRAHAARYLPQHLVAAIDAATGRAAG